MHVTSKAWIAPPYLTPPILTPFSIAGVLISSSSPSVPHFISWTHGNSSYPLPQIVLISTAPPVWFTCGVFLCCLSWKLFVIVNYNCAYYKRWKKTPPLPKLVFWTNESDCSLETSCYANWYCEDQSKVSVKYGGAEAGNIPLKHLYFFLNYSLDNWKISLFM